MLRALILAALAASGHLVVSDTELNLALSLPLDGDYQSVDLVGGPDLSLVGSPTFGSDGVTLDGTSEHLTYVQGDWSTAASGAVCFWFQTDDISAYAAVFSMSDTGSTLRFIEFGHTDAGQVFVGQRNNDTQDTIHGSSVVEINTWHHACVQSSGTAYTIQLDGVDETLVVLGGTNSGDWFGDTALTDAINVGVLQRTTKIFYLGGKVQDLRVYTSSVDASALYARGR